MQSCFLLIRPIAVFFAVLVAFAAQHNMILYYRELRFQPWLNLYISQNQQGTQKRKHLRNQRQHFCLQPNPPNRWFSRYVIAAMLVDGKQKIAHQLKLFVHQYLFISPLLFVSPKIAWSTNAIGLFVTFRLHVCFSYILDILLA